MPRCSSAAHTTHTDAPPSAAPKVLLACTCASLSALRCLKAIGEIDGKREGGHCAVLTRVCVCREGAMKGEGHETMATGQVRRRRDGVWFRECAPFTSQLTTPATIKIPQRAFGPSQDHVAACACLLRRRPCRYGLRSLFCFYRVCRRRCYSVFGGWGGERVSHMSVYLCVCVKGGTVRRPLRARRM